MLALHQVTVRPVMRSASQEASACDTVTGIRCSHQQRCVLRHQVHERETQVISQMFNMTVSTDVLVTGADHTKLFEQGCFADSWSTLDSFEVQIPHMHARNHASSAGTNLQMRHAVPVQCRWESDQASNQRVKTPRMIQNRKNRKDVCLESSVPAPSTWA